MNRILLVGLMFVSLATLTYQLLLTRIWSATIGYHFAFMSICVAMFGMTIGAVVVYVFAQFFKDEDTCRHAAVSAAIFAVTIIFSFLTQLCIPFVPGRSLMGLYVCALYFGVLIVPFGFSGICVALMLSRFSQNVGKLYAFDLIGAAAGCLIMPALLSLTDAVNAVFVAALLAAIGAACLAVGAGSARIGRFAVTVAVALFFFVSVNAWLVNQQHPLVRILWVANELEEQPLYEKWNSFSRVTVRGNPEAMEEPGGWGISEVFRRDQHKIKQLTVLLDFTAKAYMSPFSSNLSDLEFLKYDLTNLVYYLKPDAKVLVIGAGAGRDVLAALSFGAQSVVAVEVNGNVLDVLNRKFGDFSGHLDRNPRVTFVEDEARSFVCRQKEKYDIIQMASITTGMASAAGPLSLTENSVYTVEAWKMFLEHLQPNGYLSCLRSYRGGMPSEMYRLTSIARQALSELGVKNPERHILVVSSRTNGNVDQAGLILVSKEPLKAGDVQRSEQIAQDLKFTILQSPQISVTPIWAAITSGNGFAELAKDFPTNLKAPTDDDPFFFYMAPARRIFSFSTRTPNLGTRPMYTKAGVLLGQMFFVMLGLTLSVVIVPLLRKGTGINLKANIPFVTFFSAIGFAFMLIEVSQIQRLGIFLGHPVYSLTVVLFTLLVSSGIGSGLTQMVSNAGLIRRSMALLSFMVAMLVLYGLASPPVMNQMGSATTPLRIIAAMVMLFLPGLFMGMAFPLGMRMAAARCQALAPWLWGINGSSSTLASIAAVAIAIAAGISTAFWTGVACYVFALLSLLCLSRSRA